MIDKEKIIKGLECCSSDERFEKCLSAGCPYAREDENVNCINNIMRDTLILLKQASKPTLEHGLAGQPMWCCGNCGSTLFFKLRAQTDDENEKSYYNFCHYCGRKIEWT